MTSYEILMDSPLIAGAHYRRFIRQPEVALDVIADNEAELRRRRADRCAQRMVEQR